MRQLLYILLIILGIVCIAPGQNRAWAETIVFYSGKTLKGKLLSQTEDQVHFQVGKFTVSFRLENIKEIIEDPAEPIHKVTSPLRDVEDAAVSFQETERRNNFAEDLDIEDEAAVPAVIEEILPEKKLLENAPVEDVQFETFQPVDNKGEETHFVLKDSRETVYQFLQDTYHFHYSVTKDLTRQMGLYHEAKTQGNLPEGKVAIARRIKILMNGIGSLNAIPTPSSLITLKETIRKYYESLISVEEAVLNIIVNHDSLKENYMNANEQVLFWVSEYDKEYQKIVRKYQFTEIRPILERDLVFRTQLETQYFVLENETERLIVANKELQKDSSQLIDEHSKLIELLEKVIETQLNNLNMQQKKDFMRYLRHSM